MSKRAKMFREPYFMIAILAICSPAALFVFIAAISINL